MRKKKKINFLRNRIIVSVILIVFAIILGTAIGYYSYVKSKIYTKPNKIEAKAIENEDDVKYKEVEGITNVLLVGTDARDLKESARADSIIIATLDNNNKEIRLTSLFRDTLVDIEGYGPYKLNAAMALGGIELLKDTIQRTYDINIDKYIIINFWGFEAIIDKMGGLEIDIKDYQLDELNKYIGESTGGNDCPVNESGLQLLNGKQALSYARIRKGVGDEYARTDRQREVLIKVAEKLKQTKPTKYLGIMNNMLEYIKTNIEPIQALNMAYTIYKFPSLEIKQLQIPIPDLAYGGLYKNLGWVFLMDREQNAKFLDEFIFEGKVPNPKDYDYDSFNEAMSNYQTDSDEYNNKHNINPEDYLEDGDDFVTPTPSTNKGNGNSSSGSNNGSGTENSSNGNNNGTSNGNNNSGSTIQKPTIEPDKVPDNKPEQTPDKEPDKEPDKIPDKEPEQKPEETPDSKPEQTPEEPIVPPNQEPDTDTNVPVGDLEQGDSQEGVEGIQIESEI